ncbi:ATP-binding protein [Halorientalis halophila]|uniref:ATP-binding protein n=1 Tax=Halorientalis halophila TaxID=3108499 RepID=UPI0030083144
MATGSTIVVWAYHGLPVVATILHVVLGYWIYRTHWDTRGAKWFVGMLALGGTYAAITSLQMFAPWYEVKVLLYAVGGFFGLTSYVAYAGFAGRYTETDYHRQPVVKAILIAIPVGYLVQAPLQNLQNVWGSSVWIETEPFRYLAYEPGLGLLVIVLLSYAVGFYNLYKLSVYLLSTSKRATKQLGLLMAGALSIMAIAVVSNLGLFPATNFYHGVYATIPFILFTSLALFRFDLLNVQPVARSAVVENLRDPVVVLDDRRRVIDFNDASTRLWPDIADHVGDSFDSACPALSDAVSLTSDGEQAAQITLPVDGRDRHYSVTVSRVSRRGEDDTLLSVLLRDVTELEQSRWQLEKQNERLDQVASTISHDLRNPITVAESRLELMEVHVDRGTVDDETESRLRADVDEVTTATGRMQDIVDDVLTIAREGKTVEETEPISLAGAARDAWDTVDTEAATLTVDGDRQLQADRSKFLSMLENLFRNAVEHGSTSPDSQDRQDAVDHGPADVTVEIGPTDAGFYVADDGPGIPTEHEDEIFEYGYTTTEEGTGLGLSIVKTMAESHSWTVELDRDYDDGTRFVFGEVDVEPVTGRIDVETGLP